MLPASAKDEILRCARASFFPGLFTRPGISISFQTAAAWQGGLRVLVQDSTCGDATALHQFA